MRMKLLHLNPSKEIAMTHMINIISAKVNPTMEVTAKKVKTDRIDIQDVYASYSSMSIEAFKDFAIVVIAGSSGKTETKVRFCHAIHFAKTKDRVLKIVSDYYLAGNGLKV
jgi:hypothetical protein